MSGGFQAGLLTHDEKRTAIKVALARGTQFFKRPLQNTMAALQVILFITMGVSLVARYSDMSLCRWSLLAMCDPIPAWPHPVHPLAVALDGGKENSENIITYNSIIAHKDPVLCSIRWLADWLMFSVAHCGLDILQCISSKDTSWWTQHLFRAPGSDGADEPSYDFIARKLLGVVIKMVRSQAMTRARATDCCLLLASLATLLAAANQCKACCTQIGLRQSSAHTLPPGHLPAATSPANTHRPAAKANLVKTKVTHLLRNTATKEMSEAGVPLDQMKTAGRWDFSTLTLSYIYKNPLAALLVSSCKVVRLLSISPPPQAPS